MSIKQQGGVFGRNPTFNNVEVEGTLTVDGEQIPAASNIAKLDTANTFTKDKPLVEHTALIVFGQGHQVLVLAVRLEPFKMMVLPWLLVIALVI